MTPLGYAAPDARRGSNPNRPLYIALGCGIAPALLGTVVISLWMTTRHGSLPLYGGIAILFGLACTVAGGAALVIHLTRAVATRARPSRTWLLPGVLAAVVLVGNFLLCAFYMWAAGLYTVRVVNNSGANVKSFMVADPSGQRWDLGPVASGARTTRLLDCRGEGAVTFSADVNGTVQTGVVEGYMSGRYEGKTRTITLNADGTHSVR